MSQIGPWVYRQASRLNIPGHVHFYTFSCDQRLPFLTNYTWRSWLVESINHARKTLDVALWAYVFMPEHVHLLVHPRRENYRISDFMKMTKHPVAKRIVNNLKFNKSPLLEKLRTTQRGGTTRYQFWLPGGGHDNNVFTMEKAIEKARYCHNNPVKRGLVNSPEKWRWSSFRWLELGKRDNEPMSVDDWDDRIHR